MAVSSHIATDIKNADTEIEEVVSVNEVQRLIDLGLGRGVDATNLKPWKNKSSFEVREISPTLANIIGTDEGGEHQYYYREISSVHSTQLKAKLSVEVPSVDVSLGIDGEYSRSISKTRIVVGEKVATRTISFQAGFDDVSLNNTNSETEIKVNPQQPKTGDPTTKERVPSSATDPTTDSEEENSFEAKLSAWLLSRIQTRQATETDEPLVTDKRKPSTKDTGEVTVQSLKESNPIQQLTEYIRSIRSDSKLMQNIAQDCYEFVTDLGITHYVYAIHLGAVSFQTYTEKEFNSKASASANLHVGAGKLSTESLEGGVTHSKTDKDKSLHKKEIGKIEADKTVKRKTGSEAVIKIQIKPIHMLVHSRPIHLAMQRALSAYISERADKSEGPFLIACDDGDNKIYWKVNEADQVVGVKEVTAASIFYASHFDDPHHPYEFYIEYYGEDEDALKRPRGIADPMSKTTPLAPTAKFLDATLSVLGKNHGPLDVTSEVHKKNVRLTLHSRFVDSHTPFSVKSWTEGDEYFIRCSRRRFKIDGYITMNINPRYDPKSSEGSLESFQFITAIVPSIQTHNTHMLFRLLPSEHRRLSHLVGESESNNTICVSSEFEELFGKGFLFNHEKQREEV